MAFYLVVSEIITTFATEKNKLTTLSALDITEKSIHYEKERESYKGIGRHEASD